MAWNRTIAGEWARYGIRANSVVPAIATPMTGAGGEAGQELYSAIPLGGKLGDATRDFAPVMVLYYWSNHFCQWWPSDVSVRK